MARGPKKHQKRLSAPKHWLLDKLSGAYAPKASAGPHKTRDSLPLIIFLRNRLKYALNGNEVKAIVKQRLIKVDGKVRTDSTFPTGLMDVISIEKTGENFRLIYDTKGRFTVHRITAEEAQYKLGKVKRVQLGKGGIPYLVTHDARTIRYPDPAIKVNDTVKVDLATGKIEDFIKFDTGVIVMVTGGRNMGRVGVITHRERHDGGFNIVHLKDAVGRAPTTLSPSTLVIDWKCAVARNVPYEVEITIPIKDYEAVQFTLTKVCDYKQNKENHTTKGWAIFGVISFVFTLCFTLFCCGGFLYRTKFQDQHGLYALPGITILSACLQTATGVPSSYRGSESDSGNDPFLDESASGNQPTNSKVTSRRAEAKYGSI